jgi:hypothetical protein
MLVLSWSLPGGAPAWTMAKRYGEAPIPSILIVMVTA